LKQKYWTILLISLLLRVSLHADPGGERGDKSGPAGPATEGHHGGPAADGRNGNPTEHQAPMNPQMQHAQTPKSHRRRHHAAHSKVGQATGNPAPVSNQGAAPVASGHSQGQGAARSSSPSQSRQSHLAVSPKLQGLGVSQVPHRFQSRTQILSSDSAHSVMNFPRQGMNGGSIQGNMISARNYNDPLVRNHMATLANVSGGFSDAQFRGQMAQESARGQYYWHQGNGFNYCHYNDAWGYSWYGWYLGQSYFWTRYYGNSWWVYDDASNRWSYWSNGWWWWQDPDNLGQMYIYENGDYVQADFDGSPD
jgi:hypothetical protein